MVTNYRAVSENMPTGRSTVQTGRIFNRSGARSADANNAELFQRAWWFPAKARRFGEIMRLSQPMKGQRMSPILVSSIVFACVFGGAVLGILSRGALPQHHLSAETEGVVRLGMGMVATMGWNSASSYEFVYRERDHCNEAYQASP